FSFYAFMEVLFVAVAMTALRFNITARFSLHWLRVLLQIASTIVRDCFGFGSTRLRSPSERKPLHSDRPRSAVEAGSKPPRTDVEQVPKRSRSALEQPSKRTRRTVDE